MQLPRETHTGLVAYCNVNMKCPPGPLLDEKIKLLGIEKLQSSRARLSTALLYVQKVATPLLSI